MPELPELEIICEVLTRRVVGRKIASAEVAPKGGPIIIRNLINLKFEETLTGKRVISASRRGKYILLNLDPERIILAINPKLTGRLQLAQPGAKKAGPVHITFHFSDPDEELRYVDQKKMGQVYLTHDLSLIPMFDKLGPEALEIAREEFRSRLRAYRGEIKGILTRGSFIAGIGNAYADEILWSARLHPYRKRPSLEQQEVDRLYDALRAVLHEAIQEIRGRMGDEIHRKPRDFFAVHMKHGEGCPRCSTRISLITANQRITNFCRTCQPGGLFRGM